LLGSPEKAGVGGSIPSLATTAKLVKQLKLSGFLSVPVLDMYSEWALVFKL